MNGQYIAGLFGFAIGASFLWFFVAALVFKKRIKPKIKWWMLLAGLPVVSTMYLIVLFIESLFLHSSDTTSTAGMIFNMVINPVILPLMLSIFYWFMVELKFSKKLT